MRAKRDAGCEEIEKIIHSGVGEMNGNLHFSVLFVGRGLVVGDGCWRTEGRCRRESLLSQRRIGHPRSWNFSLLGQLVQSRL